MAVKLGTDNRKRRGAVWTEDEDKQLMAIANLPPRTIADLMRRSWLACRRRLSHLRSTGIAPGTSGHQAPHSRPTR